MIKRLAKLNRNLSPLQKLAIILFLASTAVCIMVDWKFCAGIAGVFISGMFFDKGRRA